MTLAVTDGNGVTSSATTSITVNPVPVPSDAWIGLRNSDDVGTKFDVLVEFLKNGSVVSSGELDAVREDFAGRRRYAFERLRTMGLNPGWPAGVQQGSVSRGGRRVAAAGAVQLNRG